MKQRQDGTAFARDSQRFRSRFICCGATEQKKSSDDGLSFRFSFIVQKAVIRADVFIAAIFLSETSRDLARLDKPQPLIQMTCMDVAFHHCIELKDTESRIAGFFMQSVTSFSPIC